MHVSLRPFQPIKVQKEKGGHSKDWIGKDRNARVIKTFPTNQGSERKRRPLGRLDDRGARVIQTHSTNHVSAQHVCNKKEAFFY